MDFSQAMRVLGAFARHGVEYVLVGSMAMAAQGLVRATRDMDVFVSPDPANVERLKAALRELFADPSIDDIEARHGLRLPLGVGVRARRRHHPCTGPPESRGQW